VELRKYGQQIMEMNTSDLEVHSLAKINPSMTNSDFDELKASLSECGYDKNFPVFLYKKKIVDGLHRHKACTELGIKKMWVKHLPQNMDISEVKELVIRTDNRRHKTPTQKAISAYRYYLEKMAEGNKLSQLEVSAKFGTSKLMMSRVIKLEKLAGEQRIEALFNGRKLTIKNKEGNIISTDSLLTLIGYYQNIVEEEISSSKNPSEDLSDDELTTVDKLYQEISLVCNNQMLEILQKKIWNLLKHKE
jgi:hypothetical protein